jgi:hypothetical protein
MHDTTGANLKRVPDSSESDDKNADSDKGSDDSDDGNMSTDDDDTLAAQPGAARARAILNAEVRMLHLKCILMQNVASVRLLRAARPRSRTIVTTTN